MSKNRILIAGSPSVDLANLFAVLTRGRAEIASPHPSITSFSWQIDTKYYKAEVEIWLTQPTNFSEFETSVDLIKEGERVDALILAFNRRQVFGSG